MNMGNITPKTIAMIGGALGGVAIGAGALQAVGIDAGAFAEDVATIVVNGLAGCPVEPEPVCDAGHRVASVLALAGISALCGWLTRMGAPAGATATPPQPGEETLLASGEATLGPSGAAEAAPAARDHLKA